MPLKSNQLKSLVPYKSTSDEKLDWTNGSYANWLVFGKDAMETHPRAGVHIFLRTVPARSTLLSFIIMRLSGSGVSPQMRLTTTMIQCGASFSSGNRLLRG